MKLKIKCVFLIFMLSISITACSSKEVVSDKKASDTTVPISQSVPIVPSTKVAPIVPIPNEVDTIPKKIPEELTKYKTILDAIEPNLAYLKEKDGGSTKDMKEAADIRYKKYDDTLNQIYNGLKKTLSPTDMEKVKIEEIQWIKDRDAEAKKESLQFKGGTVEPIVYINTLIKMTKDRCYELADEYIY